VCDRAGYCAEAAGYAPLCVPLYREVAGQQCHDIIALQQVSGETDEALAIVISPSPGAEPVLRRFNQLPMPPVLSDSPGDVSPALCMAR